ncbi:Hpt domain protein [Solidesulfovibrio carbinoliphilus subsp. oakridgensis]|uniref:Hpt domain protein n=1 Tax=Solidesulfovibrio carbinoliphilus subsp. oakridgensis TaxID=694327 RepID=G7Q798_9BACT|nr:Hpt domain-containing protein [Solidesulfovibrio carbinoliphilus]EHJ49055.1 Hpt domain protein [Solidesulfovibrio carbinoliphilus subsp. oakridgensis]
MRPQDPQNGKTLGRVMAFLQDAHFLTPDEAAQALAVAAEVLGQALARLEKAAGAGDAGACAEAAHGLKGNLLNLGLPDLAALAEEAFAKARRGDLDPARAAGRTLGTALAPLLPDGRPPA